MSPTEPEIVVLAREAASVVRGFYDDVTPCVHRLSTGARCALCGRARALLVECDAIVENGAGMDAFGVEHQPWAGESADATSEQTTSLSDDTLRPDENVR